MVVVAFSGTPRWNDIVLATRSRRSGNDVDNVLLEGREALLFPDTCDCAPNPSAAGCSRMTPRRRDSLISPPVMLSRLTTSACTSASHPVGPATSWSGTTCSSSRGLRRSRKARTRDIRTASGSRRDACDLLTRRASSARSRAVNLSHARATARGREARRTGYANDNFARGEPDTHREEDLVPRVQVIKGAADGDDGVGGGVPPSVCVGRRRLCFAGATRCGWYGLRGKSRDL